MKSLFIRILIYGSFITMYIMAILRIESEDALMAFSIFSLIFFLVLSLVYELNTQD